MPTIVKQSVNAPELAVKSAGGHGFLPSLIYMIHTIPKRQRDCNSKQAKNLLDLHGLVFHNRTRYQCQPEYPNKRSYSLWLPIHSMTTLCWSTPAS